MRFLGIDYGTKKIGLSVSDEKGMLAFPNGIVLNDKNIFKSIENILKKEDITDIVIGESNDKGGQPNSVGGDIDLFAKELEKRFGIVVYKQKEFFTSVEARRDVSVGKKVNSTSYNKKKKEKNKKVDDIAYALILQRFLDQRSRQEGGINKI